MSTAVNDAREAFVDNLHAMATGSYLREEDKEFWEAPYPESVVNEARVIVDSLVDATSRIPGLTPEDLGALASSTDVLQAPQEGEGPVDPDQLTRAVVASITPAVEDLVRLSAKYDGAVVEDEELEDLNALLKAVCEDMGADFSVVSGHVQIMVESD